MNDTDHPILDSLTQIFSEDNTQEEITSEDVVSSIELKNIGLDDEVFYSSIIECSEPVVAFEEIEIACIGSVPKYTAGRHSFEPITITVESNDEVVKIIQQQLCKQQESFNGEASLVDDYKFDLHLTYKNDSWDVKGCWLQQVDYVDIDSQHYTCELIIRYDHAMIY